MRRASPTTFHSLGKGALPSHPQSLHQGKGPPQTEAPISVGLFPPLSLATAMAPSFMPPLQPPLHLSLSLEHRHPASGFAEPPGLASLSCHTPAPEVEVPPLLSLWPGSPSTCPVTSPLHTAFSPLLKPLALEFFLWRKGNKSD